MNIAFLWRKFQERFWLGPEELAGGTRHFRLHLATWVGGLWLRYFLQRKFTLPAILLMPPAAIVLLYAALVIQSAMALPALLILSTGIAAVLTSFFFRPRGRLARSIPCRVRAGETFTIRYRFTSTRNMPVYDLVCDPFDWAPHLERTGRAVMTAIPGNGTAECAVSVHAVRRGAVRLYRPLAESAFPLELVKWSVRGNAARKLLIYPAFTPLEKIVIPSGTGKRNTGNSLSALPGDSPNLLGCRDFRAGDAIRHIDWPGSARRGALVVKEFAREEFREIALIADSCPPRWPYRPEHAASMELEAAMSLAAAAADSLLNRNTVLDLLAAGRVIKEFRTRGRNRAHFDRLCDVLAEVVPEKSFPAAELNRVLTPLLRNTAAAIVLLLDNTPERREFVNRLARTGIALKVILLAEHPASAEIPADWRRIRPADVFAGKITAL